VKLATIQSPDLYDCIFIPGGHGPMFDLATSELLADMLTKAAAAGRCWSGSVRCGRVGKPIPAVDVYVYASSGSLWLLGSRPCSVVDVNVYPHYTG
jgi:hypothetical protein